MSEPENFMSRWSRRKLEADDEPAAPQRVPEVAQPPESRADDTVPDEKAPPKEDEPQFDIASLPSVDSITSATDIRVFLQKGVPAHLTRAALRRAWVADPAIRDFREIAENQWDFATGSDLPGFGSLDVSPDDLRRMVAEVFGGGAKPVDEVKVVATDDVQPADRTADTEGATPPAAPMRDQMVMASQDQLLSDAPIANQKEDIVRRSEIDVATQQSNEDAEYVPARGRRSHGGALPQ